MYVCKNYLCICKQYHANGPSVYVAVLAAWVVVGVDVVVGRVAEYVVHTTSLAVVSVTGVCTWVDWSGIRFENLR